MRHYDQIMDEQDLLNNKSSTIHKKWVDYKTLRPDTVFEYKVPRGDDFLYENVRTEAARHEKIHKPVFDLIQPRVIAPDFNIKKPHQDIRQRSPHKPVCMQYMPMCTWKNRKFIQEKTQARAVGHVVKEALFDKQLDGKPADSKGQSANVSEKNENPLSREGTNAEKVPIDIQTPQVTSKGPPLPSDMARGQDSRGERGRKNTLQSDEIAKTRRGLTIQMQDQRSGFKNLGSEERRHRSLANDIEFDLQQQTTGEKIILIADELKAK